MANFYLDICLSDIPKERIKTAANCKKYLKAIINPRRSPDSDGYDHYIAAFVPKDERNEGDRPAFIGRAQEKHYGDAQAQKPVQQHPAENHQPAASGDDDLPF